MEVSESKEKILYGLFTVFISTAIAVSVYHLWGADWNVPLAGYRGDSVGLLLELNNYVRGGFVHHHVVYGEPYIGSYSSSLCDYSLIMPTLKLFWRMTGSIEKAVNIHAVMNSTVMSLCMYWVCIRLKNRPFSAMTAGVLYGSLPFFYLYGNTVMMTYSVAFYLPLFCYVLLEVMRENGKFTVYNVQNALFVSLVMLYVGVSSAYYAFFSLIFLVFVGLYVLIVRKSAGSVLMVVQSFIAIGLGISVYTIPGILHGLGYTQIVLSLGYGLYLLTELFAILVLVGILAVFKKIYPHITLKIIYLIVIAFFVMTISAGAFLLQYTDYIGQYDGRTLNAVEAGSLKAVSMVLPAVNDILGSGDVILRAVTEVGNREASDFAMNGVMAGIGFIYSMAHVFEYKEKSNRDERLKLCGLLNCFAILIAIRGGASSVIAMFVTTGIRNYNRMCVFIAALGMISLAIFIDRIVDVILHKIIRKGIKRVVYFSLAVGYSACVLMSIPFDFVYNNTFGFVEYDQRKREYDEWQCYVGAIESGISQNGMILELPLSIDGAYMGKLMTDGRAYELNVPISVSQTTCWNTGGEIRGELLSILNNNEDINDFLILAGAYGYEGIYIDTLMYHDESYKQILEQLEQHLGEPLICNENRRYFYSMADYNRKMNEQYSDMELTMIAGESTVQ